MMAGGVAIWAVGRKKEKENGGRGEGRWVEGGCRAVVGLKNREGKER
jgi:hypothetical protein